MLLKYTLGCLHTKLLLHVASGLTTWTGIFFSADIWLLKNNEKVHKDKVDDFTVQLSTC